MQNLTRVRAGTIRRDFISNVSHELRTPLASLKALTDTLRDGAIDDPKRPRFLNRIETEVDALTQMSSELLELTRIKSGQVPLELKAAIPAEIASFLSRPDAGADGRRASGRMKFQKTSQHRRSVQVGTGAGQPGA